MTPAATRRTQPLPAQKSLSTPALRAFFRVAGLWGLDTAQERTLLGNPPASTYFKWKKEPEAANLSRDVLERISYVLGIYKALQILFADAARADAWIKRANEAPLFQGGARSSACSGATSRTCSSCGNISTPSAGSAVLKAPPRRAIDWRAHRIVPSRFPPVGPWDRIADPADFEALAEIDALTNPRLREELGVLALIPPERRVSGPGTTPIMAAFTHLNPEGSRFSDGTYGVFYAARELETSLRETVYHSERFLARTREPATRVEMRCYVTRIAATFHDIRGGYPALHDPDSYSASQKCGGNCASKVRTGSSTTACDSRAGSASPCSGPTASGAARSRVTMRIAGMAR
jgi:hypothetical protein